MDSPSGGRGEEKTFLGLISIFKMTFNVDKKPARQLWYGNSEKDNCTLLLDQFSVECPK